jgi:hypothetical protein
LRNQVRQLEADLTGQGVALFASTAVGRRAHALWRKIRPHLLRGGSVDISPSALGLSWHRMELKRARDILLQMGLVRPQSDGRYALGTYDPDELAREAFLDLRLMEGVLGALGGLMGKSKTQKRS